MFKKEVGGHRFQRIPPNEKRGRVQSSTITVAALPIQETDTKLDMRDVVIETTRGSGPGGQHQNTTDSCVVVRHVPTKLTARVNLKSQNQSRRVALEILGARYRELVEGKARMEIAGVRRDQVGTGERGDKIRTYRQKDNIVIDHRTGKKGKLDDWMARGKI